MAKAELLTLRTYLVMKACADQSRTLRDHRAVDLPAINMAVEAVASTALAHPEWNMNEKHSWSDWEARSR